jgi:hypothetical protein
MSIPSCSTIDTASNVADSRNDNRETRAARGASTTETAPAKKKGVPDDRGAPEAGQHAQLSREIRQIGHRNQEQDTLSKRVWFDDAPGCLAPRCDWPGQANA